MSSILQWQPNNFPPLNRYRDEASLVMVMVMVVVMVMVMVMVMVVVMVMVMVMVVVMVMVMVTLIVTIHCISGPSIGDGFPAPWSHFER